MAVMLEELKQRMKKQNPSQTLSYYTMFCLGEFYVSSLLFRHVMFEENPDQFKQEKKTETAHEHFRFLSC